ncbi:hypothetical protein Taro_024381, partial [Colocasia esculenta]|nr:hypothetical protein [Colocasia esculenta]
LVGADVVAAPVQARALAGAGAGAGAGTSAGSAGAGASKVGRGRTWALALAEAGVGARAREGQGRCLKPTGASPGADVGKRIREVNFVMLTKFLYDTAETEAWFVDSFEEWRKAKNLSNFILLGHSFGGYVAAKYALKFQLIHRHKFSKELGLLSFTEKSDFLSNVWYGPLHLSCSGLGPWGPDLVRRYTTARFGSYATGDVLNEEESNLLTDYVYHTLAAKASGELCLKYIFSFGAFARRPLLHRCENLHEGEVLSVLEICFLWNLSFFGWKAHLFVISYSASDWKVPTTFIYGYQDWMDYRGAQAARADMKVPCEIIRVPQAGHFVFIDNPAAFHSAVFHACRGFLSPDKEEQPLPEGLTSA